jgi:ABC-type transport system involved in multi-copper enzyme maturation permease subunit
MVLAIVRKELRETWLFVALALGLSIICLCKLTGKWNFLLTQLVGWFPGMSGESPDVPFVADDFTGMLFFIGAALAIALGFRQSAWEPSQGTALYLLHLPLTRRSIFLTKLFTGIGLLLACTLLPILIYATWAATPGTHAGPFEWSMTVPAFQLWLLMPLVYLGAFACGIRPARWFGSRLLPLVAVGFTGALLAMLSQWSLIAAPLLLLATVVLVSDILWEVETRDFEPGAVHHCMVHGG